MYTQEDVKRGVAATWSFLLYGWIVFKEMWLIRIESVAKTRTKREGLCFFCVLGVVVVSLSLLLCAWGFALGGTHREEHHEEDPWQCEPSERRTDTQLWKRSPRMLRDSIKTRSSGVRARLFFGKSLFSPPPASL